jgi:hypothetical protein
MREFVYTREFDRQWEALGLAIDDQLRLENELIKNPGAGAVIRGTGGLRKFRFALEGRGKSGGARVLYIDFVAGERVYFVAAYAKNVQETLSAEQKAILKKVVTGLKSDMEGLKNGGH